MIQILEKETIQNQSSILEYRLFSIDSGEKAKKIVPAGSEKKTFDWHDKIILIAEDEEFNFLYLREILGPTKATILRAMDGEMAVQICQSSPIDLVLMDIKMPRMNGLEATKSIRSFNIHLPVIAQTAYAMVEDSEKCLGAGCTDYLTKPISSKVLLALLDQYLRP
jgi:two-component system, cell cycle response regulator DivK